MSPRKHYWLMKTEPDGFSIDDLRKVGTEPWTGVRNYQARNFMRSMQAGDGVLFYHSSTEVPGIYGLAEVASAPYPDPTQFDPKNTYYDPKSTPEAPRWHHVDVRLLKKTRLLGLPELRTIPELADMRVLQKGNRLSITPVSAAEWRKISGLLR